MLPDQYSVRLADLNVRELKDEDIAWADMVMVSAMIIQQDSFNDVVVRCKGMGKTVVAGGPYATSSHELIENVDHFILGEGEVTIPLFIKDYEKGTALAVYKSDERPDLKNSPVPRFDLVRMDDYGALPLQYSRGCPFSCEFCDIIQMFGRKPRVKAAEQFITELEAAYDTGYRGPVFIVDDNFIGHRAEVTRLLKGIAEWQRIKNYPFTFFTEASINLAGENEILDLMVECGFNMVFMGIETPDENTLTAINKGQNVKHNIFDSVKTVQSRGIEVTAGFILGFDTDTDDIFDRQINFIQNAGIPMAMIGLMLALPGTQLYERLEREGRILNFTSGNNTNRLDMNFIPVMDRDKLAEGYKKVIRTIYSPDKYFERSIRLIKAIPPKKLKGRSLQKGDITALLKSLALQTFSPYGHRYILFLLKTLFINPGNFPLAVNLAIKGYHFFRITKMTLESRETKNDDRTMNSTGHVMRKKEFAIQ